jgi:predicted dienelactone hydrolase
MAHCSDRTLDASGPGRQRRIFDRQRSKPTGRGIAGWYPAKATASEHDLGLFTQDIAPDAAVSGVSHPLIVMSHGNGGTLEGHYDTALALARAGFVVAAVTHTGDNYKDQSQATHLIAAPAAAAATFVGSRSGSVSRVSIAVRTFISASDRADETFGARPANVSANETQPNRAAYP